MKHGISVSRGRRGRRKKKGRVFSGSAFLLWSVLFAVCTGGLHGQTAADMDGLLNSGEITWAQACRFVLPAAGALEENAPPETAFTEAREKGWLPKGAAADRYVTLGELSFLLLKSFSIKESFLYTLFPGPRYAYRQLDYLGLLPGLRDPALKVSGERLLLILGRVLSYRGDEEAVPEQREIPEAPPAAAEDALREQREQMVREIRTDLEARGVADTTVRAGEEGVVISLNNIQFMSDDAELMEGERMKLMRIAVILAQYPERKILVGGHTAQAGTPEGRSLVSTRRAQAVADFLVYLDSRRPEEIVVQGYGADRPVADNSTAEGQALNRRVEIIILDE